MVSRDRFVSKRRGDTSTETMSDGAGVTNDLLYLLMMFAYCLTGSADASGGAGRERYN